MPCAPRLTAKQRQLAQQLYKYGMTRVVGESTCSFRFRHIDCERVVLANKLNAHVGKNDLCVLLQRLSDKHKGFIPEDADLVSTQWINVIQHNGMLFNYL